MRIRGTRPGLPAAGAAAICAALALLASGCGSDGDGGGGTTGKPDGSATSTSAGGGNGETPIAQTGDDDRLTPDEMAKARPLEQVEPSDAPADHSGGGGDLAPERDNGRPGQVGPKEPGHGGAVSSGASAARAAAHKPRLPVQRSPRIGRIFGKAGGNRYWFCTASVVPSRGRNLIVTAGHCLWDEHNGKALARSWQFVPGYYATGGRGHAPYGVYTARRWWAYKSWIRRQNWRYDFAFMRLRPGARGYHGAGRNVQTNVGAMGIAWNQRPNRTYVSIGYDAQKKYGWDNGSSAYYRRGRGHWIGSWAQLNLHHRYMTGGASGGPWLIKYSRSRRTGVVDGVNSRSNRRSTATSPYFGSALRKLYYSVR